MSEGDTYSGVARVLASPCLALCDARDELPCQLRVAVLQGLLRAM